MTCVRHRTDTQNTMNLHPLCTLFPRMAGAEFESLKNDIAANGLNSPVVVHDGMILDGGNRYRACQELGIEPQMVNFAGGNLVSFVLSANLHRRHMTAGQQAAIVASAQDWGRAQGHGGDRKADQVAILPLETINDRAQTSGASPRTQRMADKVAREAPELAKQVAHGEITLPDAMQAITGKRPGAKPAKPEPEPEQDLGIDPIEELERAYQRINELEEIVESLSQSEMGAECAKQTKMRQQFEALLNQRTDQLKTASDDRERMGKILKALMQHLEVDSYKAILPRIRSMGEVF